MAHEQHDLAIDQFAGGGEFGHIGDHRQHEKRQSAEVAGPAEVHQHDGQQQSEHEEGVEMIRQRQGSILNITSIGALRALPTAVHYAT